MHPIDELKARRRKLPAEIQRLQARYDAMAKSHLPRIEQLSRDADRLAEIFKPLVQQAVDTYASGDRAGAKAISNERKAKQAECEALNEQANALRTELAAAREALQVAQDEETVIDVRIKSFERLRHISLGNFSEAYGVNAMMVCKELSVLPARMLRHILAVNYVHQTMPDYAVGRTGSREHNPERTPITLYVNASSYEPARLEEDYRHTIVHEAGHVLFDWVMTNQQRQRWGELFTQTLR